MSGDKNTQTRPVLLWVALVLAVGLLAALVADEMAFNILTKSCEPPDDSADPKLASFWENTDAFEPLPSIEWGGWRATFGGKKQCFEDWVDGKRNQPTEKRRTIYIQPIGDFDQQAAPNLAVMAEYARLYFGMPVAIREPIEARNIDLEQRVNGHTGKKQWLTTDLLDALEARLPDDAYAMLGLTMIDLWPGSGWNFVFGEARLKERVGVYSLARYEPAPTSSEEAARRTMLHRSLKVMTHEVGHMFGFEHCRHYRCNMNGSNSLAETDRSPLHLCPVDLRKLQHAAGFDPGRRYEMLADFYERHGFEEQAAFARQRTGVGR